MIFIKEKSYNFFMHVFNFVKFPTGIDVRNEQIFSAFVNQFIFIISMFLILTLMRFIWDKNGEKIFFFFENLKLKFFFYETKTFAYLFDENSSYFDNKILKQNKSMLKEEVINLLYRRQKNKYYLPSVSFWPFFISMFLGSFLLSFIGMLHRDKNMFLVLWIIISFCLVLMCVVFWFWMFFVEKKSGNHIFQIRENVRLGFYLFILTEVLCFVALFWVFLHSFLASSLHIGAYNPGEGVSAFYLMERLNINKSFDVYYFSNLGFPPKMISTSSIYSYFDKDMYETKKTKFYVNMSDPGQLIDPYKLPLLNTFILLTSAATLNASHVSLKTHKFFRTTFWLFITMLLGLLFVFVQYTEYKESSIQYNDGMYSSCFYSLTGLHGIHVIIGIIALSICFINLLQKNLSVNYHQSFYYAIFYWHFVDVIWIFVYFIIYYWPASYFFYENIFAVWDKDYRTFTIHFSKKYFLDTAKFYLIDLFNLNDKKMYQKLNEMFNTKTDNNLSSDLDLSIIDEVASKSLTNKVNVHFKAQYSPEYYLKSWFELKNFWNFNSIKRDQQGLAFVLNVMHKEFFNTMEGFWSYTLINSFKLGFLSWAWLTRCETVHMLSVGKYVYYI